MQHLVLFDIDGTILKSGGAGRDAMEIALRAIFGSSGDPSYRYDGKTDKQIVRELMHGEGYDDTAIDARMPELIDRYLSGLEARLAERPDDVEVYPGVRELIGALEERAGTVIGLLTGNVEPGARLKLAAAGIDISRFRVNAFGSDHETRGELPRIAHRRMSSSFGVKLRGRDVVVIGDTPADIACGRALGARAIAVATGRFSVSELERYDPFAAFEDLSDTGAVVSAIVS